MGNRHTTSNHMDTDSDRRTAGAGRCQDGGWNLQTDYALKGFDIYPRSDCDDEQPARFSVVAPNGCALPLKPLNQGQATSIADLLNSFVDEWE